MEENSWLDKKEYPFKNNYFLVDGNQLHYIDEGHGTAIVFVHGTPSWSFEFRNAIKELSKNHRCIALDHIGFGLSDKPKNYNYSTNNHSINLEKLLTHLNLDNFILLVHDFGGPIGLNYAVNNSNKIKKIIISNTWCWSIETEPEFKKMKSILSSAFLPLLYLYFNFSAKYMLPASYGERSRLTPEIHKQFLGPLSNTKARMGTLAFAKSLLKDQLWFESIWKKIDAINSKPTLLIWGMKDKFLPEKYLRKFEATFSNSTTIKYEDAGHFVIEEKSSYASKSIIAFIDS